jgi:hypothetical protein
MQQPKSAELKRVLEVAKEPDIHVGNVQAHQPNGIN